MQEVPFVVYEATMSRFERTIRRLWILCIILVFLLVATNLAWLYYEEQFETVTTVEQEVDSGDGSGDTIVNGIGDIYGKDKTESN